MAGCAAKALEVCLREPERRARLRENTAAVREGLRALGVTVTDEPTPNAGAVMGTAEEMRGLHAALRAQGILVPYIPSYSGTGPEGLMRFAICSEHTGEMTARLLGATRDFLTNHQLQGS